MLAPPMGSCRLQTSDCMCLACAATTPLGMPHGRERPLSPWKGPRCHGSVARDRVALALMPHGHTLNNTGFRNVMRLPATVSQKARLPPPPTPDPKK